jgi:hypothetical protein
MGGDSKPIIFRDGRLCGTAEGTLRCLDQQPVFPQSGIRSRAHGMIGFV